MPSDPFLEEDFRVLTPEAFAFVLANELKRAVRSQNFLTLLLVEPTVREAVPAGGDGDAVRQIARLISREVRETDLLAQTDSRELSVVLLDADLPNSMHVVERVMARLQHYQFSPPIAIGVGAACCPTDGSDRETLHISAKNRTVYPRSGHGHGDSSSGLNQSNVQ